MGYVWGASLRGPSIVVFDNGAGDAGTQETVDQICNTTLTLGLS